MKPVWIVDDDQSIRWVLEKALERAGLAARSFSSGSDMLVALETAQPSVLVTDVRMPGMDGLTLLHEVKARHSALPVIVMTAFTDLSSTVEAFQKGAFDYLPKPFDVNAAIALIQRAGHWEDEAPNQSKRKEREFGQDRIMMRSSAPAMQEVFRAIGRLAASNVTVLVTGESGTGKELIARALHEHGSRAGMPFIALNAAAIPKDLLEAELFGHEKGAFTGATQQRRGRFEEARGGTLFLDEIGDMPFDLQTRLLRVLAEGSFYRVGGSQAIRADVRIIAATHQPLEQRVQQGRFREDLFHRLNVIRLRLPPLRERREDIPELVSLFLRNSAHDLGVAERELTPEAMAAFTAFDFPGNIRQLENFCQWLTVMSAGRRVELKDLPPEVLSYVPVARDAGEPAMQAQAAETLPASTETLTGIRVATVAMPLENGWTSLLKNEVIQRLKNNEPAIMASLTRDFEQVLIDAALEHSRGRRVEAALRLGIGRNTLTRKCSELGIGERE